MSGEIAVLDWDNLPAGVEERSLWDSLHDGELKSITSDRLARTVRLEFNVPYICKFHGFPEGTTFILTLGGVRSARVIAYESWPGEFTIDTQLSYAEQERMREAHFAKGRFDSRSWEEFESLLQTGSRAVEVSDAGCAEDEDRRFALRIAAMVDDESYINLYLSSERIAIGRSDGVTMSLKEFQESGEAYWAAFAVKGEAQRAALEQNK